MRLIGPKENVYSARAHTNNINGLRSCHENLTFNDNIIFSINLSQIIYSMIIACFYQTLNKV